MKKLNINIVILLSLVFLFSACERRINIGCLEPDGDTTTRVLNFDDFSDITISFPAETTITQGDEHIVEIEASENIIDRINSDSRKSGNDLDLEINGCVQFDEDDIRINITLPILEAIKIEGIGIVDGTNTFTTEDDMTLSIEGAGEINLDVEVESTLTAKIEGAGGISVFGTAMEFKPEIEGFGDINADEITAQIIDAKIEGGGAIDCNVTEAIKISIEGTGTVRTGGTAVTQEIKLEGAGNVRNFGLDADDTDIVISGLGDVEVNCLNTLSIKIEGAGSVCYRGAPTIENLDIEGLGDVQDCN